MSNRTGEGFVYLRVPRNSITIVDTASPLTTPYVGGQIITQVSGWFTATAPGTYHDGSPDSRVVSAKRVEDMLETQEYLQRCAAEGLTIECWSSFSSETGEQYSSTGLWWRVWRNPRKKPDMGRATLRGAYWTWKEMGR